MGGLVGKMFFKRKKEVLTQIPDSFFDLTAKEIGGQPVKFSNLRLDEGNPSGKRAFLVVNVACEWGLTKSNYTGLVALDRKYRDQGLHIMGFPSNQFFKQEKRPNDEILDYVVQAFGVEFAMFEKIEVNGENCHPVYKFLRANSVLNKNGKIQEIPWNFSKFLVDREGQVRGFFAPNIKPSKLEKEIEKLLVD